MVEAAYTPLVVLLLVVLVTGNLRVGIFAALGVGTLVLGGLGVFCRTPSGRQPGGRGEVVAGQRRTGYHRDLAQALPALIEPPR